MKQPTSEPGDSATTRDDHAAPPPCHDRSPTDSGSLGDASSSRATAPRQPSDQQAASAAAALDACATPADPDAVWSLVLTKFGRGRRGRVDLAARAFLNPDTGVRMVFGAGLAAPRAVEKPESEASDSAAAGADDAPSSSTLRRLCIRSGTVGTAPTSCSTAPPRPPELHSARAAADAQFVEKANAEAGESAAAAYGDAPPSPAPLSTSSRVVGTIGSASLGATSSCHAPVQLGLLSSPGEDPSAPLPHCHRGITIKGKEIGNYHISNSNSAPSGWLGDGLEGHPTATVANGKKLFDPEEQWEAVIAKWNMLKGQGWEVESSEGVEGVVECITNHRRLLEDKQEELKRVEQQQQQQEATLQQKEATLLQQQQQQQQEDALLLERLLLRERRIKLEEEEASRARRIRAPRLPVGNSEEGFMGRAGAAYYTDHMVRVLAVSGTNACPDLFLPLLQDAPISASTSIGDGIPLTSPTPVPTTAKPKAEDETWNKRQLGYIFYLGLAVGLVFLVRPLLPDGFDQVLLAGFAAVWGLGSVGLPLGIFGTTRLEKNLSRHIGRFISLCFSDVVIYAIYRLVVLPVDAPSASAYFSPSPPAQPGLPLGLWEFIFGIIAFLVTAGHTASWIMGYRTGGDRDLEPYED